MLRPLVQGILVHVATPQSAVCLTQPEIFTIVTLCTAHSVLYHQLCGTSYERFSTLAVLHGFSLDAAISPNSKMCYISTFASVFVLKSESSYLIRCLATTAVAEVLHEQVQERKGSAQLRTALQLSVR